MLTCIGLGACGPSTQTPPPLDAGLPQDAGPDARPVDADVDETTLEDAFDADADRSHRWENPESEDHITPYDFPGGADREHRRRVQELIGDNTGGHRIAEVYDDLDDVYRDFTLDRSVVMPCDERHEEILAYDGPPTELYTAERIARMQRYARNYFCVAEFDTDDCQVRQYRRVYLSYCLDLNDSLDWLALQSALLNTENRSLVIPAERTFHINQTLVIPSGTRMEWQSTSPPEYNGRAWVQAGASFIRLDQTEPLQREPISNFRELGFSFGTTLSIADFPFAYSGLIPYIKTSIAEDIELLHPHIDAGDYPGENGLSFAQGVRNVSVLGGEIRNVRINARDTTIAGAGGKAIQCEAGCQSVEIEGITIRDSHIGVNSSVIASYEGLNPFSEGPASELTINGLVMVNVDIPVNAYNDSEERAGTQRVDIANFYVSESGRMSDDVYLERFDEPRPTERFSDRLHGFANESFGTSFNGTSDNGLVSSLGGHSIHLRGGRFFNSSTHVGVDFLVTGWGVNSGLEDVEYRVRLNCAYHPDASGCP